MAPSTPLKLASTAAALYMLKLIFLPDLYPNAKLTTLYLTLLDLVFFIWAAWFIAIYPKFCSPLRNLPQPTSGTIYGLGFPSILLHQPPGPLFLSLLTTIPNTGLIRFPGLFNRDYLLLTSPSSLSEVLVHKSYDYEKPKDVVRFLRVILGDGLVLVEGDEHRFQRKFVATAFGYRQVRELVRVFWGKAGEMCRRVEGEMRESLGGEEGEGVVEINHWANKVTMDIIGVAGLGRDFNSLHDANDPLVAIYEGILEPTVEKALFFGANIIFGPELIAKLPWKLNQGLKETMSNLRGVCRQLVRDKREMLKGEREEEVDILSLLVRSDCFDDEMLVDQLLTFLAAGHETTSSAFTWATYLLAINPEIQSKLRAEIRANLLSPSANTNTDIDIDIDIASILESLPYLHGFCNEVLRLYPTIPTTIRISTRPTTINSQPIPKNTPIFLSPWAINRSPYLWGPTASELIPERWIDADTGKLNNHGGVSSNYANMTFLHGPRSCIGERFARWELKALVAGFCGTFEMEMEDPREVKVPAGVITSKPKGGMRLRLKVVEGW